MVLLLPLPYFLSRPFIGNVLFFSSTTTIDNLVKSNEKTEPTHCLWELIGLPAAATFITTLIAGLVSPREPSR